MVEGALQSLIDIVWLLEILLDSVMVGITQFVMSLSSNLPEFMSLQV